MNKTLRSEATIDSYPPTSNQLHNCPTCRCKSTDQYRFLHVEEQTVLTVSLFSLLLPLVEPIHPPKVYTTRKICLKLKILPDNEN